MTKQRIAIFVSMTLSLVCIFCLQVFATEIENYDFANFTEADSMAFVERCGIDTPTILVNPEELPSFTQNLILYAYSHPDIEFCFNFYETQNYAEAIRTAVRSYMNSDSIPAVAAETNYCLQENTVKNAAGVWVTHGGAWNPNWENYNCYAYAIRRAETPAFYSTQNMYSPGLQYFPGAISGTELRSRSNSGIDVYDILNATIADLEYMGYTNITHSRTMPEKDNPNQETICVRMGPGDYHFMRYDLATDAWYHKPGGSAILKYNGTPSDDNPWLYEVSRNGIESTYEDHAYNEELIFITYTKNQINIIATDTEVLRTVTIHPQKDVLYELNFERLGFYTIHLTSTNRFTFDVYDENFDEVLSDSANSSLSETLFATGNKYYLRMNFVVDSTHPPLTSDCSITVSLAPYGAIND